MLLCKRYVIFFILINSSPHKAVRATMTQEIAECEQSRTIKEEVSWRRKMTVDSASNFFNILVERKTIIWNCGSQMKRVEEEIINI